MKLNCSIIVCKWGTTKKAVLPLEKSFAYSLSSRFIRGLQHKTAFCHILSRLDVRQIALHIATNPWPHFPAPVLSGCICVPCHLGFRESLPTSSICLLAGLSLLLGTWSALKGMPMGSRTLATAAHEPLFVRSPHRKTALYHILTWWDVRLIAVSYSHW